MIWKKKRKTADREAKAARRDGRAETTMEPFSSPSGADPAGGTASIVPVTDGMMDHAAHAAAERADALAHERAETAPATRNASSEPKPATVEPTRAQAAEITAAADENADGASDAVATAASGTLRAADLAFTHGGAATGQTTENIARSAAGSIDSFGRYGAKVLEIAAANMTATGELVSALLDARSVPEAAAINADHMRRRLDAMTTQGRELLLLAQKVALDAMRPSGDGSRGP